jgi:hypothetical protein
MRRDPPQFAEEVEDKATLSSFSSGLPGVGSDEGSDHAVDESGCGFYQTIRMSFTALDFIIERMKKNLSVRARAGPASLG